MSSNPFEDLEANVDNDDDVTKPLSPGKQPAQATYGGDTTTITTTTTANTTYASTGQSQVESQGQSQQYNQYNAPPDKPEWCTKCFMWFPVRVFCLCGGFALVVSIIVDWILFRTTFLYKITGCYLIIFGIMIIFIECPTFELIRPIQLLIFYWFRILSRMWGRGFCYIFASFLTFGELEHENFTLASMVGIYLLIIALLMIIISRTSATKYRRIFLFIAQGSDPENKEEITQRLTDKFNELDLDKDEKIGSAEIIKLADQAGRILANAERDAIQTFLDVNCNGSIAKDDFVNQYLMFNIKQNWL